MSTSDVRTLGVGRYLANCDLTEKHFSFSPRSLLRWFRRHGRNLPWRKTRDPYAILVSEFMLQQTQVVTVIPYYNKWLRRFPDFASVSSLRKTMSSMRGRGSAITTGRETFVPPPALCRISTAEPCPETSVRFANCRALVAISRTQSQPLLSINRSRSSKRIARVFWPDCSTCAPRSIPQSAAKNSGRLPRNLSRSATRRVSIPRLSIWVPLFACRINRNAASAR